MFRRDVAVYLAVHLLAGVPVPAFENHKKLVRLDFETADPTDDIAVTFDGGSRAFVSAKRKVNAGAPFTSTVAGWVGQAMAGMGDEDLLALAYAEGPEWLRDLTEGLDRARTGRPVTGATRTRQLKALDALVPAEYRAMVRERARLLAVPRTATSNDSRSALVTMMGALVEGDNGAAAVSAIEAFAHDRAGRALGCNSSDLAGALNAAGLVLKVDVAGTPAARAAAQLEAFEAYQAALTADTGRIDLTLLADDLEPLVVEDLLGSIEVTPARDDERSYARNPIDLLRRWRRMLMVGQPGSGKTVALRETASYCITTDDAPTPLRVHLPDLLPRPDDSAVTVDDLVELACRRAPVKFRDALRPVLDAAVTSGDAILILDGLDECRGRAGWMAERLRTLVGQLHPDVAVVLATRANLEVPAERVGLARVDVGRPKNLDETVDAVLVACANKRIADPALRAEWLTVRRAWVADALLEQKGMLEVPQLALLVALILGSSPDLDVPQSRAELLLAAVTRSVERWERAKADGALAEKWATDLSTNMLLQGFVILGRLLENQVASPRESDALTALKAMLADAERGWGCAPARAAELAQQILTFWDERVAVFPINEHRALTSRSRVFTEVATAMWSLDADDSSLVDWVSDAIQFNDSDGAIALALGLNPRLVSTLLALGDSAPEASLAVARVVAANAEVVDAGQRETLVEQLTRHAKGVQAGLVELPHRSSRNPSEVERFFAGRSKSWPACWPLVEALCKLPLGGDLRVRRRSGVIAAALDAPNHDVAVAWCALVDARDEGRGELTGDEADLVQQVLNRRRPQAHNPVQAKGRPRVLTSRPSPPPGTGAVALMAVNHLDQLDGGSARSIYDVSEAVPHGEAEVIRSRLQGVGVNTAGWSSWKVPAGLQALASNDSEKMLLEDIAALDEGDQVELSKVERWSLIEIADLLDVTGWAQSSVGGFQSLFERDDRKGRRGWLRAVGLAFGIDLRVASAQARLVAEEESELFGLPPGWYVMSTPPLQRRGRVTPSPLGLEEQLGLLESMEFWSDWPYWISLFLLANADPLWDTDMFFRTDRRDWVPYRASALYLVSLLASSNGEGLAVEAAHSSHNAARHAARQAIEYIPDLDTDGTLSQLLGSDEDQWVRGGLDVGEPIAQYWTCRWCGQSNELSDDICRKCDLASRPDPQ